MVGVLVLSGSIVVVGVRVEVLSKVGLGVFVQMMDVTSGMFDGLGVEDCTGLDMSVVFTSWVSSVAISVASISPSSPPPLPNVFPKIKAAITTRMKNRII